MQRTNIYLDEDQLLALKHVAAQQGRSVAAVVRAAVTEYLTQDSRREAALQQFAEMVERFRADVPADASPEEIEADVEIAVAEVRLRRSLELLKTQEDWDLRWDSIVERFRERVRPYLAPDAIEAEIDLARAEVRAAALRQVSR